MNTRGRTLRQRCIPYVSFFMILIVLVMFAVILKAYLDGNFNSVESLQRYIARYGPFGPLFLITFQAMQVILPVLPGFLGCAVGSVMYGPWVGFLCNYVGISAGSILAFFLARRYGMPLIQDLFPADKYKKWSSWASKSRSYITFLFLAMLLPLFPDDYLCYFTGITQMRARKFIGIIILGKPWCILAYCLGFSLIR